MFFLKFGWIGVEPIEKCLLDEKPWASRVCDGRKRFSLL